MSDLEPCPCGGRPVMTTNYDEDMAIWDFIECRACGLRTRGKWVASRSDQCPLYFEGVRDQWNKTMRTAAKATRDAEAGE